MRGWEGCRKSGEAHWKWLWVMLVVVAYTGQWISVRKYFFIRCWQLDQPLLAVRGRIVVRDGVYQQLSEIEAGGRVNQQDSFHKFNKTASPSGAEPRGIRRSSLSLAVCIVEVNNRSRRASVAAFGLYHVT